MFFFLSLTLGFFRLDLLASEGYLNVQRDSLELRFQVRPSTFFQRCRDQQWYINHLLKKQWHHETEIKQLKDRLRREVTKNKHHSNSGGGGGNGINAPPTGCSGTSSSSNNNSGSSSSSSTNGTSITEINPPSSATSRSQPSASAISVGENCQLISVNLANNTTSSSASTSYSSSSSSEAANDSAPSSYSGAKSKNYTSAAKYSNTSNNSGKKSHSNGGGGDGGGSTRSCIKLAKEKPSPHLYDECDIGGSSNNATSFRIKSNQLMKQHRDGLPNDGKRLEFLCA